MYSCTVKSDGQLHRPSPPPAPPSPPVPVCPPPPPQRCTDHSTEHDMLIIGLIIFLVINSEKRDWYLLAALGYILLE